MDSLIITDKAPTWHNSRGTRLELLATLRRRRVDSRFLLLTPRFVPNGEQLALWLGGDGAEATIPAVFNPVTVTPEVGSNIVAIAGRRSRTGGFMGSSCPTRGAE